MQRSIVAVSALAGAVLLGAALGATTPTAMLDRNSGDWRLAVPQHSASLAYIPVGSAPESPEFGRRPLDAALLSSAHYSGDTLVLSEAANAEVVGMAGPHRTVPHTDQGFTPMALPEPMPVETVVQMQAEPEAVPADPGPLTVGAEPVDAPVAGDPEPAAQALAAVL